MDTSQNLRRLFAVAVISTFAAGFSAARADESVDARRAIVKYADLAVTSPQGAAALYHRIWGAAVTVCRPLNDDSLTGKHAMDGCIHKAVADAISRVDQPALSLVYRAKNPEPAPPALTAVNR
jgi:UrcA family protein